MKTLARLVAGSALVSGIVFGAGHVIRLADTQPPPDTAAIAVQEATAELDENSDTLRAAVAEVGRTAAPEAAYLPTASGPETRPTRKHDDADDDTPTSDSDTTGAQPEASTEARVSALAADLKRAVANGHASEAGAQRFLTEVAGYIRHESAA
ncbi:hypothetical protein M3B11_08080 [Brevibacterium sp. p3-SID960]|uniref:hypothetical protein n=1 Tax=Brevibacterium sp. p3-SID960 TaxID=2916063 RepID=UPI0021A574F8|nr:hypothetical protein [Brevibacterium sp. p3-SID960]MCT1690913.1 hypothetical protein [Brevibacterium sp. p3-SID960]